MPRSKGIDHDRILAWCCVFVAHLLAVWLLTRPHEREARARTETLEVTWVEPALTVVPMPDRDNDARRAESTEASPAAERRVVPEPDAAPIAMTPIADSDAADTEGASSLSAVFMEQGRAWAKAQSPRDDFTRNPLSRRALPRAEARPDRFVMQKELSPADVVAGIGALFGGGGDLVDCARIRERIADLATGGPGELLDEELRRDRRLCR